jgi:hypothetical protein
MHSQADSDILLFLSCGLLSIRELSPAVLQMQAIEDLDFCGICSSVRSPTTAKEEISQMLHPI